MANSLEKRKYFFIYKTTNLINGKYYIGKHCTSNMKDGYIGSGTVLRRSIRKYGKENFKCEVLEHLFNHEDLKLREKEIVNEEILKDTLCMNLQLGGGGGFSSEEHQKKCAEIGKQKFLQKLRNDAEFAEYFSKKSSQRNLERGIKGFKGKRFDWTGKTQSEEHKQNILNSKKRNKNK